MNDFIIFTLHWHYSGDQIKMNVTDCTSKTCCRDKKYTQSWSTVLISYNSDPTTFTRQT